MRALTGRLRDVELARGVDEAAGLGNHQEGARECDVHRSTLTAMYGEECIYRKRR